MSKFLLAFFVLGIAYVLPAYGIYQFAQHGSGLGSLCCFLFCLCMSFVINRALEDR